MLFQKTEDDFSRASRCPGIVVAALGVEGLPAPLSSACSSLHLRVQGTRLCSERADPGPSAHPSAPARTIAVCSRSGILTASPNQGGGGGGAEKTTSLPK